MGHHGFGPRGGPTRSSNLEGPLGVVAAGEVGADLLLTVALSGTAALAAAAGHVSVDTGLGAVGVRGGCVTVEDPVS
ncbi:hypothetical protein [Mycobacteroides abscessus]|uniref:hypothetical protein n=1 Tax=Mycobacteroides abscessus TaxID=36809 RepID=UPI0010424623|nr:hypothetical protein [Mycobacteroides abscessus]